MGLKVDKDCLVLLSMLPLTEVCVLILKFNEFSNFGNHRDQDWVLLFQPDSILENH